MAKLTAKSAPPASADSAVSSPPPDSTKRRARNRPNPLPFDFVVAPGWKSRANGRMPQPWSRTRIRSLLSSS
jgi:hypothetical protein